MELRQLQYFLIVSQEQSFSKAARKAYVSQQAISKAIQNLEEELGVALFFRNAKGVSLTPFGQKLLKDAYSISNSVNSIAYNIHRTKGNIEHTVYLAITSGAAAWLDIEKLIEFRSIYPQYRVSIVVEADNAIEHDMITEKIELGIMGAKGTTTKIEFIELSSTRTFLAVNCNNPLAEKKSVEIADLAASDFIIGSDEFYGCNQVKTLCNAAGFLPHVAHQTHDFRLINKLLQYNEGVFLCPEQIVKYMDKEKIRILPIVNDPRFFSIQLASKKDAILSEGAGLLKKYILKIYRPGGKSMDQNGT